MREEIESMLSRDDADVSGDYVPETLETAGCTGGCEYYKDGLPDCGRCSQGGNEKEIGYDSDDKRRLCEQADRLGMESLTEEEQCVVNGEISVVEV